MSTGTPRGSGGSLWISTFNFMVFYLAFYSSLSNANEHISTRGKNKTQNQPPPQTYSSLPCIFIHSHTLPTILPSRTGTHHFTRIHTHPIPLPFFYYARAQKSERTHPTRSRPLHRQPSQTPGTHPSPPNTSHRPLPIPCTPQQPHTHRDTHDIPAHRQAPGGTREHEHQPSLGAAHRETPQPHALHCAAAPERPHGPALPRYP